MATPPPAATAPIAVADAGDDGAPKRHCENCGAVLLGDHCYSCGQPTKGLIRQFSAIIGDFADTVLNIDSRIIHTVGPLLFKPGHLSLEYFAGRRVRYVSPVRLLVFIAVVTFLVAQWLTPDFGNNTINFDSDNNTFEDADSVAAVVKQRDAALAGLDHGIKESAQVPGLAATLNAEKIKLRADSDRRIAELQGKDERASAATVAAAPIPAKEPEMNFNGKPWDPVTNPVAVSWLPTSGNALLNKGVGRAKKNILRIRQDPNLLKNAIFSTAPTTLFIMVPVFALLLKILYLFKRRLYMEHVIVALHSHAFLCLNVLLLIVNSNLQDWLASTPGLLHTLFGIINFALVVWMPVYLLLMQKRVYGQGWLMTLVKYSVLGFCYIILLSFGMAGTTAVAFLWL
ncbi:MAG TPA: DUF3667 domain-containing protein [Luteimonas sp.]|nr:DUF3667 domain-containing protein [Luteimonas sp.]